MMWPLVVAALLAYVVWWHRSTRPPPGFPPGPPFSLPLVGSLPFMGGTHTQTGLKRLRQNYGDIYHVYLGARLMVVLNTYELVKEAFSKDEYSGRSELKIWSLWRGGTSLGGSPPGVIQSSGQTWTEQRRFALHALRDLGYGGRSMDEMVEEEMEAFLEGVGEEKGHSAVLTVDERLFSASVLSSLWTIVAGEKLSDPANRAKMARLLLLVPRFMSEYVSPPVQVLINYPRAFSVASALGLVGVKSALDQLLAFVGKNVEDHKATYQEDHERDFIDAYLKKAKEVEAAGQDQPSSFSGQHMELNLRNVLVDLFVAGSDTTSASLRWALLFMAKHVRVQSKVREELDRVVGRGRLARPADRADLPYTEAAISEVQRRANIANVAISHTTLKDVKLGGYVIPKGTMVLSNLNEILLDEKEFPEPLEFRPERFLDGEGNFVPNPKNIPFGYGKRRCLGENLARTQIFCFLTGILHRFVLSPAEEGQAMSEEAVMGVALTPKPFRLRFVHRTD